MHDDGGRLAVNPRPQLRDAAIPQLAAEIEELVSTMEHDWRQRGIVRPDVADHLHDICQSARRLWGEPG